MVRIISCQEKTSLEGKSFVVLQIEGEPEFIKSNKSGRYYLSSRRVNITTTFDLMTAKQLVGTKMEGNIIKIDSDPYDYKIQQTGEVIQLRHTYTYVPENITTPHKESQLVTS